ncbi:MAG: HlyD family efflux transporter periplasmic adaptor subunit [Calothrix sp. MO_167.B12]|nr:HlyD family efflux transporter periplasmic adaptor subunit [Calothrix sp. MO_167.B12]
MLYTHGQKLVPAVQSEDFLPPVSPWTSLAGIFLVGTVSSGIALASWVKYNVTVKAPALVRPTGDIRLVQPERDGTIKRILVKENQVVKYGDAIAYLDDEPLQIKKSQLQGTLDQGKLQLIQLAAQTRSLDVQIMANRRVIQRTIASAQADLQRQQRDYQLQLVTTSSESSAALASLQQAKLNLQKAESDLEFAKIDSDRYQHLSAAGAVSRRDFEQKKLIVEQSKLRLKAERKAIDVAQAKLETAQAAMNPSMAPIAIAKQRIAQEKARGEATIATLIKEKEALLQRQVELQTQFHQYQKEIQQLDTQLQSTVIRATSDGTILKLNLRNPGQVVNPTQAIAEIVPHNAPLVLKAMISTADIKNVEVNQTVLLRLNACPYPDYGTLNAVVTSISPDTISADSNGTRTASNRYFEATIKPKGLSFGNSQKTCTIQTGMNATADIISKQETALQYMLRKARLITDL